MGNVRGRWRSWPRWARWPIVGGVALGVLGVAALAVLWATVELPEDPPALQSAVVVAEDGRELAVLSEEGQRFIVPLADVSPVVVDALLSAEDRRFYDHSGVDPIGITRALVSNLRASGTQGGSTLTQQLVKNEYLTSERSLVRKVREAVLLWEPDRPAPEERAVDPEIARGITHALRGVIESGTGTAANIGRPAAGKTGTTQDNVDAWFAGYVPGYAAVVWMGHPQPAPMEGVTGGGLPAEIWQRFMAAVMDDREVEDFPDPPDELLSAAPDATSSTTSTSSSSTTEPDASSTTSTTAPDATTTSTTAPTTTTTTLEEGGSDEGASSPDPP